MYSFEGDHRLTWVLRSSARSLMPMLGWRLDWFGRWQKYVTLRLHGSDGHVHLSYQATPIRAVYCDREFFPSSPMRLSTGSVIRQRHTWKTLNIGRAGSQEWSHVCCLSLMRSMVPASPLCIRQSTWPFSFNDFIAFTFILNMHMITQHQHFRLRDTSILQSMSKPSVSNFFFLSLL